VPVSSWTVSGVEVSAVKKRQENMSCGPGYPESELYTSISSLVRANPSLVQPEKRLSAFSLTGRELGATIGFLSYALLVG
jgi:hypothetical protein